MCSIRAQTKMVLKKILDLSSLEAKLDLMKFTSLYALCECLFKNSSKSSYAEAQFRLSHSVPAFDSIRANSSAFLVVQSSCEIMASCCGISADSTSLQELNISAISAECSIVRSAIVMNLDKMSSNRSQTSKVPVPYPYYFQLKSSTQ